MANDYVKKYIGKQIEKRRKAAGISQQDLAYYLGFKRENISIMESGKQGTTVERLWMICNAFHCLPNDLFPPIKPAKTRYKTKIKTILTRTKVKVKVPTI